MTRRARRPAANSTLAMTLDSPNDRTIPNTPSSSAESKSCTEHGDCQLCVDAASSNSMLTASFKISQGVRSAVCLTAALLASSHGLSADQQQSRWAGTYLPVCPTPRRENNKYPHYTLTIFKSRKQASIAEQQALICGHIEGKKI